VDAAVAIGRLAGHDEVTPSDRPSVNEGTLGMNTMTLFRPVGPQELELIRASGWREFPPRLPEQPIFYPVLNETYAAQIASTWNVRDSGAGYVTRFRVNVGYLSRFAMQIVGAEAVHRELWVPAEELPEFNRNIVGAIEVIAEYKAEE
jgi:hypothetical protein